MLSPYFHAGYDTVNEGAIRTMNSNSAAWFN